MEETHGEFCTNSFLTSWCLNPYYNGRYSWRSSIMEFNENKQSLNPYYNGRYSWSRQYQKEDGQKGLNPYYNGRYSWRSLEEYKKSSQRRLNPYYNGRYSWRASVRR